MSAYAVISLWDQEVLSHYWFQFHSSLAPKVGFCSESRSQAPFCLRDMPVLVTSLCSLTEGFGAGAAFPELPSLRKGGLGDRISSCLLNSPSYWESAIHGEVSLHGAYSSLLSPSLQLFLSWCKGEAATCWAELVGVPRVLILKKTMRLWCWCQLLPGHPRILFPWDHVIETTGNQSLHGFIQFQILGPRRISGRMLAQLGQAPWAHCKVVKG